MSRENVETVRAFFAAWNARNMDALREMFDPDVIARSAEGWPEPGPFVGRDAVMRQIEQLRGTWDADTYELISVVDSGDRVVARQIWRGMGHGPVSEIEFSAVATLRKDSVISMELFWDHAEALEAAGLSEQDISA